MRACFFLPRTEGKPGRFELLEGQLGGVFWFDFWSFLGVTFFFFV